MNWRLWIIGGCFIALTIKTGMEAWRDYKSGAFEKRYQKWRKG